MNLEARVSKLEAATDTRAPITIWADDKTPEQIEAEITERGGFHWPARVAGGLEEGVTGNGSRAAAKRGWDCNRRSPRPSPRLLKQEKNNERI